MSYKYNKNMRDKYQKMKNENKLEKRKPFIKEKTVIIFMIIEVILMFPCFITTVSGEYLGTNLGNIIVRLETIPLLLFVFLQCFFLPEILFVLILFFALKILIVKIKQKMDYKKILIWFIIFLIICVTGFFSVDKVFSAAMSV